MLFFRLLTEIGLASRFEIRRWIGLFEQFSLDSSPCYAATDLAVVRRMDELHLSYSFAGSRMLQGLFFGEDYKIGRFKVYRLMKRTGVEAIYRNKELRGQTYEGCTDDGSSDAGSGIIPVGLISRSLKK